MDEPAMSVLERLRDALGLGPPRIDMQRIRERARYEMDLQERERLQRERMGADMPTPYRWPSGPGRPPGGMTGVRG